MTDKHNPNWGGTRTGAGRKAQSARLNVGQEVMVHETNDEHQFTEGRRGRVLEVTRNGGRIVVQMEDGWRLVIEK